jgi:hypothetical protein
LFSAQKERWIPLFIRVNRKPSSHVHQHLRSIIYVAKMADALRLLMSSISHIAPTSASAASSPTDLISPHQSRPSHIRRSSCGSTTSTSSTESCSETELLPWRYSRSRYEQGGVQDEVKRKRKETSAKRNRLADEAWKSFWG